MKYIDVNGILRDKKSSQDRFFRFLYGHALTRGMIRPFLRPWFSKLSGRLMDSRFSARFIPGFIRKNGIDMADFEEREFRSFNDFFTRRIKSSARSVPGAEEALFSPCDAYLTAAPVDSSLRFTIKYTEYTLPEFLRDEELAARFHDGTVLIFRLAVQHYHRYHFIDDGEILKEYRIPGFFHTVQPQATDRVPVYKENSRAVTLFHTAHFGDVIQVEVGALLVGRIVNRDVTEFRRAEEKGRFEFGGSTVVLVLEKDAAEILPEFLKASAEKLEHEVRFGTVIGRALKK